MWSLLKLLNSTLLTVQKQPSTMQKGMHMVVFQWNFIDTDKTLVSENII